MIFKSGSGATADRQHVTPELETTTYPTVSVSSTPTHRHKCAAKIAAGTIGVLANLFPATIFVYQARRRPLRIGIHSDLRAALKGAVTDRELALALGHYTAADGYLKALRTGTPRIGLDGQPVGEVDLIDAAYAEMRLDLRRRRRARRPSSPPTPRPVPPAPRRTSLADLRAAAAARKAAQL